MNHLNLDDVVPHMRSVLAAERDMRDLNLVWQMIEASAAISCPREVQAILPTLSRTREHFDELQRKLTSTLALQNLSELESELGSQAQCTIDILIRNLFERTADVGFLAVDDEVRRFVAGDANERDQLRAMMQRRLREYRAKYSVYDDVILCDCNGTVLLRIDDAALTQGGATNHQPITKQSTEPLIKSALSASGFVERYGVSDLAADQPALLYAHRIESAQGRSLGVLLLRFRFHDEMSAIFEALSKGTRPALRLLVDAQGQVLASSDEVHVARGEQVPLGRPGELTLTEYGGREYLLVTAVTRGYQGYQGLPWRAQVMTPLAVAFRAQPVKPDQSQVSFDSEQLTTIASEADTINRNLRRVVWNGRVMSNRRSAAGSDADRDRLKAVLAQVATSGTRTRERVAQAISELQSASIVGAQRRAQNLARLAADIMDRNLYERANDCRWWALSPALARLLTASAGGQDSTGDLNALLDHVNSLYTVYERLVVFDAQGVIRGVSREASNPAGPSRIGQSVDPQLLQSVRHLADSQKYSVTDFAVTPLADGKATYVYSAAIRGGAEQTQAFLGGIAIVFASAVEFHAMLSDLASAPGVLAAFVDHRGQVVACSDARYAPGMCLPFDGKQQLLSADGTDYAVACVPATGYREFKRMDGYRNGVSAIVALPLGKTAAAPVVAEPPPPALAAQSVQQGIDLAAFRIGMQRCAVEADAVLEAVSPRGLVRLRNAAPGVLGLLEVGHEGRPVVIQVVDGRSLLGLPAVEDLSNGAVLVLRCPGNAIQAKPMLGLWIDDLLWVAEFSRDRLQPPPAGLQLHAPLVDALVDLYGSGASMLNLLSAERLIHTVLPASAAAAALAAISQAEPRNLVVSEAKPTNATA